MDRPTWRGHRRVAHAWSRARRRRCSQSPTGAGARRVCARTASGGPDREHGQASVELVALAPLLVGVVLAVAQLLAGGAAHELADHAAEAGAIALLQGTDPEDAARDAIPGWSRGRVDVRIADRRVRVRLRPRTFVPALAKMLEATGEAHAGPSP